MRAATWEVAEGNPDTAEWAAAGQKVPRTHAQSSLLQSTLLLTVRPLNWLLGVPSVFQRVEAYYNLTACERRKSCSGTTECSPTAFVQQMRAVGVEALAQLCV